MDADYALPEAALPRLGMLLERINKRATKLGAQPISLVLGEQFATKVTGYGGRPREVAMRRVQLVGEWPRVNGWRLAGVRDGNLDEPIIVGIPGVPVDLSSLRDSGNRCDHCRVARRRNETFALLHDDGRLAIIGRNCLRDYVAHDVEWLIWEASAIRELQQTCEDEEREVGVRDPGMPTIEAYLVYVAAVIQAYGWRSSTDAKISGKTATAWLALDCATMPAAGRDADFMRWYEPVDAALEAAAVRATQALEWARQLDPEHHDAYLQNIGRLCRNKFLPKRWVGYLASTIKAYERNVEEPAARAASVHGTSEHQGEVGGTITNVPAHIEFIKTFTREFGTRNMISFRDEQGNLYVWWTGGTGLSQGEDGFLCATVKAHDSYNGEKQTIITRALLRKTPAEPKKARAKKGA
jgi:hypothetical protein